MLPGVRLAGVDVGGRDVDEARRFIVEPRPRAWNSDRLEAVAGDARFSFTPADVGLDLDEDEAWPTVARAGRHGNLSAQAFGVVTRRFRPARGRAGDVPLRQRPAGAAPSKRWAERLRCRPRSTAALQIEGATVAADRRGRAAACCGTGPADAW